MDEFGCVLDRREGWRLSPEMVRYYRVTSCGMRSCGSAGMTHVHDLFK